MLRRLLRSLSGGMSQAGYPDGVSGSTFEVPDSSDARRRSTPR
jgi:hypothetical protein